MPKHEAYLEGGIRTPSGQPIPHEISHEVLPEVKVGDWLMYRYGTERRRRLLAQVVDFGILNTDDDGDEDFDHNAPLVNLHLETADDSGLFRRFKRPWLIWFDPEYGEVLDMFLRIQIKQNNPDENFIWDDEKADAVSTKMYDEPYLLFRGESSTVLLQQCLVDELPGEINDV